MIDIAEKAAIDWWKAAFLPPSLGNSVFSFRGDKVTLVSNKVSGFLDQSGNGRDFIQTTDADRPTHTDNTLIFTTNEFLDGSAHIAAVTSLNTGTFITRVKRDSDSFVFPLTASEIGVDNRLMQTIRIPTDAVGSDEVQIIRQHGGASIGTDSVGAGLTHPNFFTISVRTNGSRYLLRSNGVNLTVGANDNGQWFNDVGGTLDTLLIGAFKFSAGNFFSEISLKGLDLYSDEKTDAEIAQIERFYLTL